MGCSVGYLGIGDWGLGIRMLNDEQGMGIR
jgi:hypothetical protein